MELGMAKKEEDNRDVFEKALDIAPYALVAAGAVGASRFGRRFGSKTKKAMEDRSTKSSRDATSPKSPEEVVGTRSRDTYSSKTPVEVGGATGARGSFFSRPFKPKTSDYLDRPMRRK